MDNILSGILTFDWLLSGLLGLLLGWLIWGRNRQIGDLSIKGENQLRTEADSLRARVNELEGRLTARDGESADSESKSAGDDGAAAADDDETYALEWRNRYLAARVKYLEGRIAEVPGLKKGSPGKGAVAGKTTKPRVLYDRPNEGKPDNLKLIGGVGTKLENLLNDNGVYYFRQIANWNKANIKMVSDRLGVPARIESDGWVRQAKKLAKEVGAAAVDVGKSSGGDENGKYLADVRKYDPGAKQRTVGNIVKYCGVALYSRGTSMVACTDEAGLDRVARDFCTKKLGMKSDQMEVVKNVCEQMQGQRFKNRVTFYYLCAKKARKLTVFN
jgi:predicted flap endonuclease-1-like 5' DNA nuclease